MQYSGAAETIEVTGSGNVLSTAVQAAAEWFINGALEELDELLEQSAEEGVQALKQESAPHGAAYAGDWTASVKRRHSPYGKRYIHEVTLYQPNKYRVAHLLESGTALRFYVTKSGQTRHTGAVTGDGHITRAFEKIKQDLNKKIGGN